MLVGVFYAEQRTSKEGEPRTNRETGRAIYAANDTVRTGRQNDRTGGSCLKSVNIANGIRTAYKTDPLQGEQAARVRLSEPF